MKLLIIFFCLILEGTALNAQKAANHYVQDKLSLPSTNFEITTNANNDTISIAEFVNLSTNQPDRKNVIKKYMGTPLFLNSWQKGNLFSKNSSPVSGTLSYNLLNDKVFFSQGPVQPAIEIKPTAFRIGTYFFEQLDDHVKKAGKHYYERIEMNGKTYYKRYLKYLITDFKHPEIIDTSDSESYEGSFVSENKYYLIQDQQIRQIDHTLKAFGQLKKRAKEIVTNYNLDLRKETDLIELLKYL